MVNTDGEGQTGENVEKGMPGQMEPNGETGECTESSGEEMDIPLIVDPDAHMAEMMCHVGKLKFHFLV